MDGQRIARISTCCEYRCPPGFWVNRKSSGLRLVSVSNGTPCIKCQVDAFVREQQLLRKDVEQDLQRELELTKELRDSRVTPPNGSKYDGSSASPAPPSRKHTAPALSASEDLSITVRSPVEAQPTPEATNDKSSSPDQATMPSSHVDDAALIDIIDNPALPETAPVEAAISSDTANEDALTVTKRYEDDAFDEDDYADEDFEKEEEPRAEESTTPTDLDADAPQASIAAELPLASDVTTSSPERQDVTTTGNDASDDDVSVSSGSSPQRFDSPAHPEPEPEPEPTQAAAAPVCLKSVVSSC